MKRLFFISIFTLLCVALFAQESNTKFTIQDYLKLTTINSPQFSPDGDWIVCSIGDKEKWDGKRNNNLWIFSPDGKKQVQLTNSKKSDYGPRWSPDGSKIAFLSDRADKTQIYIISIKGGEACQFTDSDEAVQIFDWIDDNTIAYVCNEPRDEFIVEAEEKAGGGYVVDNKFRKSALWIQSFLTSSVPQKIVGNDYFIAAMDAASDGQHFVLQAADDSEQYKQIADGRIILVNKSGNEVYRFENAETFSNPTFSPDNQHIAFVGNTVGYSANNALFIANLETKTTRILTEEFDPTIQGLQWIDNKSIALKTPRNIYTGMYKLSMNGKIETLLDPYWVIYGFSIHPKSKQFAFVGTRKKQPIELMVNKFKKDPSGAKKLTSKNVWITNKKLGNSKVIKFPSTDNFLIEAVVTFPPGFNCETKYPIMVLPHGGPDGIVTDRFNLLGQLLAGEGIIVYQPNFRGGIGYGAQFYAANRGKLGYIDYDDIMAGLDYLINQGIVDTTKMVVGGWSYGGYMTNWIIGHTNRFQAAVSVAGIANTVSMYAQSDINHGELAGWEFMGVPVLDKQNYERSSPLTFLKNCKTPTLIMHGEADIRVPVSQAWELYRALVDLDVEVEMVLYPDARHGIRAPKQYADVFTRWIEWYNRYLEN